ncbi:hypothetical protein B4113_1285 [Geobacillus sp. B4113_201601]|nr:hypothetical protein B4113_1285 [Geobacillus sp. B4113_201601]
MQDGSCSEAKGEWGMRQDATEGGDRTVGRMGIAQPIFRHKMG